MEKLFLLLPQWVVVTSSFVVVVASLAIIALLVDRLAERVIRIEYGRAKTVVSFNPHDPTCSEPEAPSSK
jgi:hypothetical protein